MMEKILLQEKDIIIQVVLKKNQKKSLRQKQKLKQKKKLLDLEDIDSVLKNKKLFLWNINKI